MNPSLSIYLEALRLAATLLVFVAHGLSLYEPFAAFAEVHKLGRDGVVIFFVLSGFVISWCASERDRSFTVFAVNRASRIYSVALPAIALGIVVSLLLTWLRADGQLEYQIRRLWLYLPIYLSFSGNLWYLNEVPPQNFPYWSLYFEVWYYLIFAVFFYLRGRWRWPAVLLLAAIAGPEILLLAPLWMAGSALYFKGGTLRLGQAAARSLLVATALAYLLMKVFAIDALLDSAIAPVWHAFGLTAHIPKQLFGDYAIGVLVCLHIVAARSAGLDWSAPAERVLKFWASHSFSFYLYHVPLFSLLAVLLPDRSSLLHYLAVMALSTLAILLLARVTEHRKGDYRRLLFALVRPAPQPLGR